MRRKEPLVKIIKLKPQFKETLWGGHWLKDHFGFETPSDHVGECWAISAMPSGDCLLDGGSYDGETLSHFYAHHHEFFGTDPHPEFPLLVKIIDAAADLSIQVHPDDAYAQAHLGQNGKTEAWIVLKAAPNTQIELGHQAPDHATFEAWARAGLWKKLLQYRHLHTGEVVFVPAGTVHALCKGTAVLEIQQASDVTYRLYDYDRVDANGQKRPLHLDQAIAVAKAPDVPQPLPPLEWKDGRTHRALLLECPYFRIYSLAVNGSHGWDNHHEGYYLMSVLSGQGRIRRYDIHAGDQLILAAGYHHPVVTGTLKAILTEVLWDHPLL